VSQFKFFPFGLFLFGSLLSAQSNITVPRCGGGGGPHPLSDISEMFPSSTKILETDEGVQEFTFSEKRQTLYYRTDSNRFIERPLSGASHEIGKSLLPLSRIMDEDYLLFAARGMAAVTARNPYQWRVFQGPQAQTFGHVFFDKGVLYSQDIPKTWQNQSSIYQYRPFEGAAQRKCTLSNLIPASGNQFPLVFYYGVQFTSRGNILTVYDVDVRSCKIVHEVVFSDPIYSDILAVHRFADLGGIAVEVKHPTKNLMWYQAGIGCDFYNLNAGQQTSGSRLRVLNYKSPWMASFSSRDGLSLVNFALQNRARIPILSVEDVSYVYMTENGDRLFLNPKVAGLDARPLMEVTLPLH